MPLDEHSMPKEALDEWDRIVKEEMAKNLPMNELTERLAVLRQEYTQRYKQYDIKLRGPTFKRS